MSENSLPQSGLNALIPSQSRLRSFRLSRNGAETSFNELNSTGKRTLRGSLIPTPKFNVPSSPFQSTFMDYNETICESPTIANNSSPQSNRTKRSELNASIPNQSTPGSSRLSRNGGGAETSFNELNATGKRTLRGSLIPTPKFNVPSSPFQSTFMDYDETICESPTIANNSSPQSNKTKRSELNASTTSQSTPGSSRLSRNGGGAETSFSELNSTGKRTLRGSLIPTPKFNVPSSPFQATYVDCNERTLSSYPNSQDSEGCSQESITSIFGTKRRTSAVSSIIPTPRLNVRHSLFHSNYFDDNYNNKTQTSSISNSQSFINSPVYKKAKNQRFSYIPSFECNLPKSPSYLAATRKESYAPRFQSNFLLQLNNNYRTTDSLKSFVNKPQLTATMRPAVVPIVATAVFNKEHNVHSNDNNDHWDDSDDHCNDNNKEDSVQDTHTLDDTKLDKKLVDQTTISLSSDFNTPIHTSTSQTQISGESLFNVVSPVPNFYNNSSDNESGYDICIDESSINMEAKVKNATNTLFDSSMFTTGAHDDTIGNVDALQDISMLSLNDDTLVADENTMNQTVNSTFNTSIHLNMMNQTQMSCGTCYSPHVRHVVMKAETAPSPVYVIPAPKILNNNDDQEAENGLRRSKRNRLPRLNILQQPIYERDKDGNLNLVGATDPIIRDKLLKQYGVGDPIVAADREREMKHRKKLENAKKKILRSRQVTDL